MNLRTFETASEFLDVVGPTWFESEAEDSLPLGIALRVRDGHRYGDEPPFFACVEQAGRLPLIALRTPPYNLVLSAREPEPEALSLVAGHLNAHGGALPGVQGRVGVAGAFAETWKNLTGTDWTVSMEQRLYKLTHVTRPVGVPGCARPADVGDADLLTEWAGGFIDEALPHDTRDGLREMIDRATVARTLLVWEDKEPVSMCAQTRPTPHAASISFVYTPPALRGRGYASACVAELSQRILDSGKSFSTLFTDLANPTSNSIYQRIGYRPLCDFREIRFLSHD
jgi:predicted GNAT family acetyltransferase